MMTTHNSNYYPMTMTTDSTPWRQWRGTRHPRDRDQDALDILTAALQPPQTQQALTTTPKECIMLSDLKSLDLARCDLDTLIALSASAKQLAAEYATWGLDGPDWLVKRQRALARAIPAALEAELDKAQDELKALQEKAQQREEVEARMAKLRKALK